MNWGYLKNCGFSVTTMREPYKNQKETDPLKGISPTRSVKHMRGSDDATVFFLVFFLVSIPTKRNRVPRKKQTHVIIMVEAIVCWYFR